MSSIKILCCAAIVVAGSAFVESLPSIPPAPAASPEASLIEFVERHATSDGGYGWYSSDEPTLPPDPHLTPTHAAIGIYHLLGRQAPRRDALVRAVIELHPYRGSRAESVKHAAEVWPLTYEQLEALRWLNAADPDRDPGIADVRKWTEQWTGISAYPATYERAAHPVLQLEMFGLLTRRLAGLPVEQTLQTLVPYLDARQRENGSFNNVPAAQGGDGHVMNTWWAIAALRAADKPIARQASLIAWLRACQRPNGGFASSPKAAKDALGLDDLQYTWAAVKALAALGGVASDQAAAIGYLRTLRSSDGGFSHRPKEPSDIVAAYYALDALSVLKALAPLPPVPAAPTVTTRTAPAAADSLPAGLRAYTIQIQAPGQGSPEDAVELARSLRIHLWGAKNTTAEWIRAAQAIARERGVPVTFFSAGEVYGQFVSLPGLGSYSHVADDMSPLPVAAGMPPVPRQQVERTWPEFVERRVQPLEREGGRLVWQISDNEEFSRTLLDASMRGATGYGAISTFHMRQNFVAILPWLQRYRHAIPFVTLQDAHGTEPWWWASDLTAHRTVFLAPPAAAGQGPSWNDWLDALRHNRVVSIRRDAITRFRTRAIGGAPGVRARVLKASGEWQWWNDGTTENAPATHAIARHPVARDATAREVIARPLASIVALSVASDAVEAGRPERGVRLRIRLAWENDTQGRPVREIARLVTLRVDGRDVAVSPHERRDDRGRLIDSYALADVSTLAAGTHTATAIVTHIETSAEHQVTRTFLVTDGAARDSMAAAPPGAASIATASVAAGSSAVPARSSGRAPNIVFILADDLGYGEIGPFGQTKIETPRLDRFAAEGMRFTHFYAGSAVCAPSRASLLTGKHSGHAYVRGNHELGGFADEEERGQLALPPDEPTLARWLRARGYATAAIGKWGLGGPGSTGLPTRQGFDLFFGYLDQKQAHNYYPTHLWKNEERFPLRNAYFSPHQRLDATANAADPSAYTRFTGSDYAIDRMTAEAVTFLETCAGRRDTPCFLYYAPTMPHLALQVPEAALARYAGRFQETPYTGDRGYLPHRTPRAAYAAMITHLDTQVGILLDTLRKLDLDRETIVFFTSDNGARGNGGGADTRFFASNGTLRGTKGTLYEGGIRVPMLARWPGRVAAGTTSTHPAANWDMWATFVDLANADAQAPAPTSAPAIADTDGVSFAPTLLGKSGQQPREALYWEFHEGGKSQAVRMGKWKAVRRFARGAARASGAERATPKGTPQGPSEGAPQGAIELYDLERDPSESQDVAADHPDVVARIAAIMRREHKPAVLDQWNFPATAADANATRGR